MAARRTDEMFNGYVDFAIVRPDRPQFEWAALAVGGLWLTAAMEIKTRRQRRETSSAEPSPLTRRASEGFRPRFLADSPRVWRLTNGLGGVTARRGARQTVAPRLARSDSNWPAEPSFWFLGVM